MKKGMITYIALTAILLVSMVLYTSSLEKIPEGQIQFSPDDTPIKTKSTTWVLIVAIILLTIIAVSGVLFYLITFKPK